LISLRRTAARTRSGPRWPPRPARSACGAAGPDPVGDFLAFMGAFPTGVAVVTAIGPGARPCGMTCSSLASVTLTPPTLLVSLRANASGALGSVLRRGAFGVNLLHGGARETAELMARTLPDRFAELDWRPSPRLGIPWLIGDAHAAAECRVSRSVLIGDHVVVFGEVAGCIRQAGQPLLYGFRNYATWQGSA
jgi:flavin reductase (NADH)